MRRRAVGVVGARLLGARGADDPAARDGQANVVAAVVGEELGVGVELMRRPGAAFEDGQLREPVRDEVVVADGAGARERTRHVRLPRDAQHDLARRAAPPPAAPRRQAFDPLCCRRRAARRRSAGMQIDGRAVRRALASASCCDVDRAPSPRCADVARRRPASAASRIHDESALRHAFQYKCSRSESGRRAADVAPADHAPCPSASASRDRGAPSSVVVRVAR